VVLPNLGRAQLVFCGATPSRVCEIVKPGRLDVHSDIETGALARPAGAFLRAARVSTAGAFLRVARVSETTPARCACKRALHWTYFGVFGYRPMSSTVNAVRARAEGIVKKKWPIRNFNALFRRRHCAALPEGCSDAMKCVLSTL